MVNSIYESLSSILNRKYLSFVVVYSLKDFGKSFLSMPADSPILNNRRRAIYSMEILAVNFHEMLSSTRLGYSKIFYHLNYIRKRAGPFHQPQLPVLKKSLPLMLLL